MAKEELEHVEDEEEKPAQTEQETPAEDAPDESSEQPSEVASGQVNDAAESGDSATGGGQQDQAWNAREYAEKNLGFTGVSAQYSNDSDFLTALAQHREQLHQQAEQHRRENELLRAQMSQQPKKEPPAEQPKKLFERPEYDPRWETMLVKDEATGQLTVKPGFDPTVLQKYTAHHDARRKFIEDFADDPDVAIGKLIDQRAEAIIEQRMGKKFEEVQGRGLADQYFERNRTWLQLHDADQHPVHDNTGMPILSPAGKLFGNYLDRAAKMGIASVEDRLSYAEGFAQRDLLAQDRQRTDAKSKGDKQKKDVLARGNRKPSRAGSTIGSTPGNNGAEQNSSLSLREKMHANFEKAGINEIT